MIIERSKQSVDEVSKAVIGKTEVVEKVLMTIYAGGHVLLYGFGTAYFLWLLLILLGLCILNVALIRTDGRGREDFWAQAVSPSKWKSAM